jgi:hypothetical protein
MSEMTARRSRAVPSEMVRIIEPVSISGIPFVLAEILVRISNGV